MARIRVQCPHCLTSALVGPEQVLLVPRGGGGTYLSCCPACGRVTDGPAAPEQVLLLAAAGVLLVDGGAPRVRGEQQ